MGAIRAENAEGVRLRVRAAPRRQWHVLTAALLLETVTNAGGSGGRQPSSVVVCITPDDGFNMVTNTSDAARVTSEIDVQGFDADLRELVREGCRT